MIILHIISIRSTREEYRRLYNFPRDYIYGKSLVSLKNRYICNRMAIHLLTSSIKTSILIVFSLSLSIWIPIYMTLVLKKNKMVYQVILPFTDPTTQNGFMINFIHQLMTITTAFVILPGVELVICILKNTTLVTAAVIENSLIEFSNRLGGNQSVPFSNEMAYHFRNIILQISDFDRLMCSFIYT